MATRLVDLGAVSSPGVRRNFERLDKFAREQVDILTLNVALHDTRIADLESKNVAFYNSYAHALTAGTTRWFNHDNTLTTYDPRSTLAFVNGGGPPNDYTKWTCPLTGVYTVVFRVAFSGETAGTSLIGVRISRNGGADEVLWEDIAPRTTPLTSAACPLFFTVGDVIKFGVRSSTAANMDAGRVSFVLEAKQ